MQINTSFLNTYTVKLIQVIVMKKYNIKKYNVILYLRKGSLFAGYMFHKYAANTEI